MKGTRYRQSYLVLRSVEVQVGTKEGNKDKNEFHVESTRIDSVK